MKTLLLAVSSVCILILIHIMWPEKNIYILNGSAYNCTQIDDTAFMCEGTMPAMVAL